MDDMDRILLCIEKAEKYKFSKECHEKEINRWMKITETPLWEVLNGKIRAIPAFRKYSTRIKRKD